MKEDGKQLLSALTFHEKSLKYEYVWKLFLKHKYRLDYQVCLKFDVVESLFINFGVVDIGNCFKLIEYSLLLIHTIKKALRNKEFSDEIQ